MSRHYLLLKAISLGHFYQHPWQLILMWAGLTASVTVVVAIYLASYSAHQNFISASNLFIGKATHQIRGQPLVDEQLYVELKQRFNVPATPQLQATVWDSSKHQSYQLLATDLLIDDVISSTLGLSLTTLNIPLTQFIFSDMPPNALLLSSESIPSISQQVSSQQFSYQNTSFHLNVTHLRPNQPQHNQGTLGVDLLLMDIGIGQQVLNMQGQLTAINLVLTHDKQIDLLKDWLPKPYALVPVNDERQALDNLANAFHLNLHALSLLAFIIGLFLMFNALRFSLQQRERLISQLRSLGIPSKAIQIYLLCEVFLIASVASATGLLLGWLLANPLLIMITQSINQFYYALAHTKLQYSIIQFLLSWASTVLIAVGCSWWSITHIAKRPPLQLVRTSHQLAHIHQHLFPYWQRLAATCLVVTVSMIMLPTGIMGGFIATATGLLGFALCLPQLVTVISKFNRPSKASNQPIFIKMLLRDSQRQLHHTAYALMALLIAISASGGINLMVSSFHSAFQHWLQQRVSADLYIRLAEHSLPSTRLQVLYEQLATNKQIASLSTYMSQQILWRNEQVKIQSGQWSQKTQDSMLFLRRPSQLIWHDVITKNHILINEPLARRHQLKWGDEIKLDWAGHTATFTIAGVFYDYGSPQGQLWMQPFDYQRFFPEIKTKGIALYLTADTNVDTFIQTINKQWPQHTFVITQQQQIIERATHIFKQTFVITDVLNGIALGIALCAITAALMATQLARLPEMRLLHALGCNGWLRAGLLIGQPIFLGIVTGLFAIPATLLQGWLLTEVVNVRSFGWSIPLTPNLVLVGQILGLSLAAAVLGSLYPTWKTLHTPARQAGWE
ncbi:FtsX-like permease family protein [Zooshikella harenae]|uniref:ABC transporter permease n=1 Tax=Zooshikella harenae TaxID=2827238 RepID=A0ABS5Z8M4_9GAMM|nr:ABC transporter permease [Zooshikella harenae]MBU2710393.1 ABC transporter permease [Zooshikella harenae]